MTRNAYLGGASPPIPGEPAIELRRVYRQLLVVAAAVGLVGVTLIASGCRPRPAHPQPRIRLAQGEIRPGESIVVPLPLRAGQYFRAAVEHQGIEVELSLLGPDGKKVAAGGRVSREGVKVLASITRTAGIYRLRASAPATESAAGRYDLFVEARRSVRPEDYSRVSAQKRLSEGLRARDPSGRDQRSDLPRALSQFEEALQLWRKAGDVEGEVDTVNEIGVTEIKLGRPTEARGRFEAALAMARQSGYVRGQAEALNALGLALYRLRQLEAALAAYRKSIELWKNLGEAGEQATTLNNLGRLLDRDFHRLDEASRSFGESLALYKQVGDEAGEAFSLTSLGVVAEDRGDLEAALKYYGDALDLSRKAGDRDLEATILANMAGVDLSRGNLQRALALYDAALTNGGPGDPFDEARIVHNLASLYVALGKPDLALARYRQTLELQRGDPASTAYTWNSIGDLTAASDPAAAGEDFSLALKISRNARSRNSEALSLHNLGRLHLALGKQQIALKELEQALDLRKGLPDLVGRARTLLEIGIAHSQLRPPVQDASSFKRALELARKVSDRDLISRCLLEQATLDRERGDFGKARGEIEEALQVLESVRSDVGSDDLRTSFFAAHRAYYDFYVDLLMRLAERERRKEYFAQALAASEQARARGLLDLLAEGKIGVNSGIAIDLKRRETALASELAWTEGQLRLARQAAVPDETAAKQLEDRLGEIERKQQALIGEIRDKNPRYAEVRYPTPPDAVKIEQGLGEKTALLEYMVVRERTFLFVVTHDGLDAYSLPIGAGALEDRVSRLRRALKSANPALRVDYIREAIDLYQSLIAPAAESLAGKRDLLISPDGILHLLPFEALLTETPTGSQDYSHLPYLLRRYAITYVPSASVYAGLRPPHIAPTAAERGSAKAFIAFANPSYESQRNGIPSFQLLPKSESEVRRIASLFPPGDVQLYVGREATKDNIIGNPLLERTPRVHFAVHGVLDEQRPQLSGLALAPGRDKDDDGFLRVHEIFNLKLNADLVVLSACDTGGTQVTGEGLVGLTRAFFYAGASSLVVSLWRASDDSAPELMAEFYSQLAQGKGAALQAAKLAMIKEGRYAQPFYWAPFVLVGRAL